MTERLYGTDSYERTFSAKVLKIENDDEGVRVLLDRTLFYPTSGGQPHDTGVLGDARVVGVENHSSEGRDEVWHRLEGVVPREGERVEGRVDWPRRYRHMQRHTAQHLLSQALLRVDPTFATVSVSLSSTVCTVDVAAEPSPEALREVERVVMDAVYANYEVFVAEVPDTELATYPLRRPPRVTGMVRLVRMGDWEVSACGGTHLSRSGEAGPVKILRSERTKGGGARLSFVSGWEALEDYTRKHEVAYGLAREFHARVHEVPERVAGVQNELSDAKGQIATLQRRLAEALSRELLAKATPLVHGRVVTHTLEPDDVGLLVPLAEILVQEGDVCALLAAPTGERINLLFARGSEVDAAMNVLLREVLPLVDGRGGGKPERAQGSGTRLEGTAEALESARACFETGGGVGK